MNMIELIKSIVESYEDIDQLHIDYTGAVPDSYGLSSTGDMLLKEDILGNKTRQHNFVLYTVWQSQSDYDRMTNSGILLGLQCHLEKQAKGQNVLSPDKENGTLKRITCSNGMLYSVPNSNLNAGVIYQLQITAQYKIESEEI